MKNQIKTQHGDIFNIFVNDLQMLENHWFGISWGWGIIWQNYSFYS